MKKVKGGVLLFLFVGVAFGSRDFLLSPGGKHIPYDPEAKSLPKELKKLTKARPEVVPQAYLTADDFKLGWEDGGTPYTFGFDEGDSMGLYLEPLAGAIVKKVFIYNTDFVGDWCFFLNDALYDGEATSPGACVDGAGWVGYYGHVDENGDTVWSEPGEAQFWVEGDNECFNTPPIGAEIWPGLGSGCHTVEFTPESRGTWIELDLAVPGYPDTVWAPFFVTAGIDFEDLENYPDSWGIGAYGAVELPYHGFKYYNNVSRGEPGWWLRGFGWEIYTLVEYVEDFAPCIEDVTVLPTWLKTDARPVRATITDGVDLAKLWYAVNDGDPIAVTMTADADTFRADIPANITAPGDEVEYWVSATFLEGDSCESRHFTYMHYAGVEENLFVNNSSYPDWIAGYYLFGVSAYGEWPHDIWNTANFGPPTYELFSNYISVVEVQGGGPSMCSEGLDTWLDEGGHYYLIAGDKYLSACFYGWPGPLEIPEGDFPYDYLGLKYYYPDINYAASGDQNGVSRLFSVEDDPTSGDLFDFLADSLLLNYDPAYELGNDNWLDGVGVVDGATISYWGLSGILDSVLAPPADADTYAVAANITLSSGSKTAFFGFDALSLNTMGVSATALHGEGYHWFGVYPEGPIPMTLLNWGLILGLKDDVAGLPSKFALHQNYPNPFNPVTTINFDIPSDGNVTLTIYNMLGQKVATLVNDFRRAGRHTITWNGTTDLGKAVATGVYLYRINAGDFSATRKMILLK